jgi:hypothetical protein
VVELSNGQIKLYSPQTENINNKYKLSFSGEDTYFHDHQTLIQKITTNSNKYEIFGGGGDDILEVDLNGVEHVEIYYDGENNFTGTKGDALIISKKYSPLIEFYYQNKSDGIVKIGNNTITYVNLEPISNTGTASDIVFTYPMVNKTITISDDGTASDGFTLINSDAAEATTFNNPMNSITINASSGNDVVNFNGLDNLSPPPTIIIDGGSGTNTLIIDAMGNGAIDNGSSVTLNGLYTINYSNFTTITINNQAPQVPTLSQWGLIILFLFLLLIGTIALKSNSPKKIYITRVRL